MGLFGPPLTFEPVLAKGPESMNALQVDRDLHIDLQPPAVFVNHSCEPNLTR